MKVACGETSITSKNMVVKNVVMSLLLFIATQSFSAADTNTEADFIRNLLSGYDSRVFPGPENTSLLISVSYYMTQLQGLNEKEQTLTTSGAVVLKWMDENLVWDKTFTKRSFVELNIEDVWKPAIVLGNSVNEGEDFTKRKGATVTFHSDGRLDLNTFGKDTTFCAMNLKYFPFDKHICRIGFIHWIRYGIKYRGQIIQNEGIEFKSEFGALRMLSRQNEEWDLLNITLVTQNIDNVIDNHDIVFPSFEIVIELQRKPNFYVMILMVPSVLVALISIAGFLLPTEAGEKVSLQLTALLSYILLFVMVVDIIPPIGGNFPLLAQLLIGGQITSTVNLFLTIIILRLFHHDSTPVPKGLRFIFFKMISPMVLLDVGNVNVGSNEVSAGNSETEQDDDNASNDTRSQEATNSKEFCDTQTFFELLQKLQYFRKDEIDGNAEEWQLISRALDRILFVLNLVFVSIGFAYGYITVATN